MFIPISLISLAILSLLAIIPSLVKVTLTMDGKTSLDISFTLFNLKLYNFSQSKERSVVGADFYRALLSRIKKLLNECTVTLEELCIPGISDERSSQSFYTSPYAYHIVISALIAYLRSNTQKLYIRDNAVILIPNRQGGFSLRISARARVFNVARTLLYILSDKKAMERG